MKQLNPQLLAPFILISTLLLTGCASTFTSKINTVNQLPEVLSNKTYVLQEHAEQAKEPEYLHASEDVKTRLQELGFQQAEASTSALKVSLQLVSIPGDTHVTSPFGSINYLVTPSGMVIPLGGFGDPRFFPISIRSPYRFYPRAMFSSRFYNPYYSPFYFGNRLHPFYLQELNVRQYVEHGINIVISEASSGKVLYSVSAKTTQNDTDIAPYIALLIESALREFPNKTGESKIEIQLEK